MRIGEKIQILRKQKNISQEQLAEELNISRQAVSKWETGECLPDMENIVLLSSIFGVTTDYLVKPQHGGVPTVVHQPDNATNENVDSYANNEIELIDDGDFEGSGAFRIGSGEGGYTFSFSFRGIVYPMALLAFLILGFGFGLWRPGWMVFPIAWVIEEIISFLKTGRLSFSIYNLAMIVFLILGFGWRLWHPGWIVFIAAWALREAVKIKKHS